jgi:PAT family beta-lactamase induction signal transducer AmpG
VLWLEALLSLFSATQDIALDAYRRELLSEVELFLGKAVHVSAYLVNGLVPGSLTLILADLLPWSSRSTNSCGATDCVARC